uniref:Uncharacterized protein n=1 Tax=Oryza punctata TaxID=4537 RepID=A0A0E0LNM2_ORYPU
MEGGHTFVSADEQAVGKLKLKFNRFPQWSRAPTLKPISNLGKHGMRRKMTRAELVGGIWAHRAIALPLGQPPLRLEARPPPRVRGVQSLFYLEAGPRTNVRSGQPPLRLGPHNCSILRWPSAVFKYLPES